MYSFARAAVTKYHKLDGLKTKMYCLAVPEAGNPRSICQQGWFLPRGRISPTSPLPASGGSLETSAILWLPEASPPSLPSSSQGDGWFWWSWYRRSTYVVHTYRIHQSGPWLEPFVLSTPLHVLEFATLLVLCYILERFFSTLQFYSQCALTFWFLAYCVWFSLLLRFWCFCCCC